MNSVMLYYSLASHDNIKGPLVAPFIPTLETSIPSHPVIYNGFGVTEGDDLID